MSYEEFVSRKMVKKLPEGYSIHIGDYRGRFEEVLVLDENGIKAGAAYTSVYGLHRAAKKAIEEALETHFIKNRPVRHWQKFWKIFGKEA